MIVRALPDEVDGGHIENPFVHLSVHHDTLLFKPNSIHVSYMPNNLSPASSIMAQHQLHTAVD